MIEIEDIRRLDVRQGDVLVVRLNQVATDAVRERIIELFNTILAPLGAKAIVIDRGITLDILSKAPESKEGVGV